MSVTRKATTVRLPDYLLADLHTEAHRRNISVSRLLEDIVEEKMYSSHAETFADIEEDSSDKPNAATLAAFQETEAGISGGTFDTSSFEAFKKSMGL